MPRLTDQQQLERRLHILDAARRCFIRDGFHRSSMQAICREAGISAGAVYVYFDSKEALIAGLIELDRAGLAAEFEAATAAPDLHAALTELGRRHFVEEGCKSSALTIQVWAESARDPRIRAMCLGIEHDVARHLLTIFTELRRRGGMAPGVDLERLVELVAIHSDGIFKAKALDPDFDGERAFAGLIGIINAALAGHLTAPATASFTLETAS